MFIDEETKLKIVMAADGAPAGLVSMFHPSQLEKCPNGQALLQVKVRRWYEKREAS